MTSFIELGGPEFDRTLVPLAIVSVTNTKRRFELTDFANEIACVKVVKKKTKAGTCSSTVLAVVHMNQL